jgi:hypothetical protein
VSTSSTTPSPTELLVIPTTSLTSPTVVALQNLYPAVAIMRDDWDYARLFTRLWRRGQTFVLVEHDILPPAGFPESLLDCPEPYCGHYYRLGRRLGGTLGCVKFAADLIAEHSNLSFDCPWWELDGQVVAALGIEDFHVHQPPAVHLHADGVIPTADPYVWIEERRPGYVRYSDGDREWEVIGTCAWTDPMTWGPCGEGAAEPSPGSPEGRLDVPVAPGFQCSLCVDKGHLVVREL